MSETIISRPTRTSPVFITSAGQRVTVVQSASPIPAGSGGTRLAGYDVNLTAPQFGDVLAFGVGEWINNPQENLTDGGNF